jgi:hypothetical protein
MNIKSLLISMLLTSAALCSCSGDHSAKAGADTGKIAAPMTGTADSSKVTTNTGDAGNVDNSGSGGTQITKDSAANKSKGDSAKK